MYGIRSLLLSLNNANGTPSYPASLLFERLAHWNQLVEPPSQVTIQPW